MRSGIGRWAVIAVGLVAVLGASGCGGTTTVSGKVTHAGKPVVWGSVTLVDGTGTYHQAAIGLDGTYKIDNVPTGPVKIAVSSPKPRDDSGKGAKGGKTAPAAGGAGAPDDPREKFLRDQGITPDAGPPPPPPGAWFPIPDKYLDAATSGLTGTVTVGQPLDIDIPK